MEQKRTQEEEHKIYSATSNMMTIVLAFLHMFYKPIVFMHVWNWFVTVAIGVQTIGYWLSFALLLMVNFTVPNSRQLTAQIYKKVVEDVHELASHSFNRVAGAIVGASLVWGIAFLIKTFAM